MPVASEVMDVGYADMAEGGRDMNFGCAIVARVVEGLGSRSGSLGGKGGSLGGKGGSLRGKGGSLYRKTTALTAR
jgi:hypothetical protein